jgi:rhodanese-related sulfurtransferase
MSLCRLLERTIPSAYHGQSSFETSWVPIMPKTCSPKALHDLIAAADGEYAVVDVRGERAFSDGHLMHAISAPLGRLEVMIGDLAPRLTTPIYLTDGSEGFAEKAATRLEAVGYTDVNILEGGTKGWGDAGYEVYGGFNVPSSAHRQFRQKN